MQRRGLRCIALGATACAIGLFWSASAAAQTSTADPDPWFAPDKALHFGVSASLAGGGYALGALATDDVAGRIAVGAAIALSAGVAKEALDAAGLGKPSWRDFTWDVIGTSFGLGVAVTLDFAMR